MLQRAILWLLVAISWLTNFEPSPYEYLFLVAVIVFLPNGMSVARVMLPFLVFLILYNIGGALSVVPISSSTKAITFIVTSFYMAVMAMFFAFVCAKAPLKIMAVIRNGYIFAAVLASICGLMGYFDIAGTGEIWAPSSRAQGTFKDPNVFSTFLILPTVFLIQSLTTGTQNLKVLAIIALIIILAAVFFAFSRGAWLVLLVSTAMSLTLTFIVTPSLALRSRMILYASIGGIGLICLLVFALSFVEIRDFFFERAQLIQFYDGGETGRFGRQLRSIPLLLQSPNGLGPFGFDKIFGQDPHNVYLNAFAVYGWLGGFSYLLLIAASIAAGWRVVFTRTPWQPYAIVVFATLFAIMLQGILIDTDHWRHFYLQLGLLWGLYAATEIHLRNATANQASV